MLEGERQRERDFADLRKAASAYSCSAISSEVPRRSGASISRAAPAALRYAASGLLDIARILRALLGRRLSVGMTTSPCETRACLPSGW